MTSITIPQLDDDFSTRLKMRADAHGRSPEAEAKTIIRDALSQEPEPTGRDLARSIREKYAPFDPFELDIPRRHYEREPPRFDDEWPGPSECLSSTRMCCPN